MYLRGSCRNQPYCSHVCAANSLDFLNIPVAFFVHQLEEKRDKYKREALLLFQISNQIGVNCQFKFIFITGCVGKQIQMQFKITIFVCLCKFMLYVADYRFKQAKSHLVVIPYFEELSRPPPLLIILHQ